MSWTLEGGTDLNDDAHWKFDIGTTVKALESPNDANKSKGMVGVVKDIWPTVKEKWENDACVECRIVYSYLVKFPKGPNGQQVWSLAFREANLESVDIDLGGS